MPMPTSTAGYTVAFRVSANSSRMSREPVQFFGATTTECGRSAEDDGGKLRDGDDRHESGHRGRDPAITPRRQAQHDGEDDEHDRAGDRDREHRNGIELGE